MYGLPMSLICFFFFFNDTATTEIYTLSLHDALPILAAALLDDPVHRGEAEAGALPDFLGREERLEQVCLGHLIHADAGVRDRQADVIAGGHAVTPLDVLLVERDARRPDAQPAAAGHGVAGVDGEVQEHLLELPRVGVDRARGGVARRGELG